jgi:hypothetical protein
MTRCLGALPLGTPRLALSFAFGFSGRATLSPGVLGGLILSEKRGEKPATFDRRRHGFCRTCHDGTLFGPGSQGRDQRQSGGQNNDTGHPEHQRTCSC